MATTTVTAGLVKPRACRRCKTTGFVETHVKHLNIPGLCMACNGGGYVESDPATLAQRKAEREYAMRCDRVESDLYRRTADHKLTKEQSYQVWAAYNGLKLLKATEPERYAKAVEAHYAGHPKLAEALAAYYIEHQED